MEPHELYHRARLSWFGILRLATKLFIIIPPTLFFNLFHAVPQCILRGLPVLPFIYCNLLRTLMNTLTPTELQFILPPTGTVYRVWLAAVVSKSILTHDDDKTKTPSRLRPDIQPLSDGKSSILWLGDRTTATKFVLFLHGGGYVLPLDLGHLNWCRNAYLSAAEEAGGEDNVAVAVLQYSLWPAASYPTQLFQAAEALSVILDGGRVSPADVVFGGDSCGGHMAAGLLAHLVHPLPGARKIELPEGQRFAGAFFVSPWLSSADDGPAFRENAYLDMVSPEVVRQSTALTNSGLGGARSYEAVQALGWAMPGDVGDSTWWDGVDEVVGDVLVTVGRREVLREEIASFAKRIRVRNPGTNVVLDVRPRAAHDFILLEGQLNRVGGATSQMKSWYKDILRRKS
ncbi:Alpha/Beta hydrolase protein [Diaporthe sp. PMI_573]|nr:Alpha/Beta hydrolase protein [Diaporthaceae sp. PMI_573]